jgi:vacuolar protein sorting-associated protein 13A/C
MVHGRIASLQITVPWSNLPNKPVLVALRDIHVVVRPKPHVGNDAAAQKILENSRKQSRLAAHEDMLAHQTKSNDQNGTVAHAAAAAAAAAAKAAAENTFYAKLMTKIVDNLQVTIDDVHLRYEDDVSDAAHPFACGVTLERIAAQSCNEAWQPAFVADEGAAVRKRVRLSQCAVYWSTDAELLLPRLAGRDIGPRLNQLIARTNDVPTGMQYILAPASASLKVSFGFGVLIAQSRL